MTGRNGEQMCRRIALKKAALQDHVQTEWSEAPRDVSRYRARAHTHAQKHTLQLKHLSPA